MSWAAGAASWCGVGTGGGGQALPGAVPEHPLGTVVLGDGLEVFGLGEGKLPFGVDGLQDGADPELASALGEFEKASCGDDGSRGQADLPLGSLGSGPELHDFPGDVVAELFVFQLCHPEAGVGGADAASIPDAAGADPPGEADAIVLEVVGISGGAVASTGEATEGGLGTKGGKPRPLGGSVPSGTGEAGKGIGAAQFRAEGEGRGDE